MITKEFIIANPGIIPNCFSALVLRLQYISQLLYSFGYRSAALGKASFIRLTLSPLNADDPPSVAG
ncbi:hypothetical protein J3D56_002035 [Erwinia persicina]|uniref:hypothetical protein n=1 Tax=Erwinia persicina TaxID=55211 RepID=UPI00209CE2C6|nr:hypothetical protein [Erwinia persicina]MCP1438599.1 hypothetical protein [Erwinia persicina]